MKKTQQLGPSLIGLPIFERATLLPLARIDKVLLRAENLTLTYYSTITADETTSRYIHCDQVAPLNGWLTTNRAENFGEADDFVRDAQLIQTQCTLFGYQVRDTNKKYLGKIDDYSFTLPDLQVGRLYVKRPFWQRLQGDQFILPSSHIVEVLPEKMTVIVQPITKKVRQTAAKAIPA